MYPCEAKGFGAWLPQSSWPKRFFSILRCEFLDRQQWDNRDQLAGATFEWIEAWIIPTRRHSYNKGLSPFDYETATAA